MKTMGLTHKENNELSTIQRKALAERLYSGRMYTDELVEVAQKTDQLFPVREISTGPTTYKRSIELKPFDSINIETDDGGRDIFDYFSRNHVVGCLIVKDGKTLFEQYQHGVTPQSRWMSMSMAKSVSTTLIGAAVVDGYINSIDDPITDYLTDRKTSAYADVTIRQLMHMTSGVGWNDDHTDPSSERRHMLTLQSEHQPDVILDYVMSRSKVAPSGDIWNYSMGETHVVGALVHAATGRWLSDYLSEKIWSRMGMQSEALWWLEAQDSLEVAGAGICATLRDYVRFGEFMLTGGVIKGERILPEWWVEEATKPVLEATVNRTYGFMWWPVADRAGSHENRAYSARGIFGQYIYINPAHNIVIGVNSARAKPLHSEVIPDDDFFNAVVDFLV